MYSSLKTARVIHTTNPELSVHTNHLTGASPSLKFQYKYDSHSLAFYFLIIRELGSPLPSTVHLNFVLFLVKVGQIALAARHHCRKLISISFINYTPIHMYNMLLHCMQACTMRHTFYTFWKIWRYSIVWGQQRGYRRGCSELLLLIVRAHHDYASSSPSSAPAPPTRICVLGYYCVRATQQNFPHCHQSDRHTDRQSFQKHGRHQYLSSK